MVFQRLRRRSGIVLAESEWLLNRINHSPTDSTSDVPARDDSKTASVDRFRNRNKYIVYLCPGVCECLCGPESDNELANQNRFSARRGKFSSTSPRAPWYQPTPGSRIGRVRRQQHRRNSSEPQTTNKLLFGYRPNNVILNQQKPTPPYSTLCTPKHSGQLLSKTDLVTVSPRCGRFLFQFRPKSIWMR